MRFLWLDNDGPVIYIGGKQKDLAGKEGEVVSFPLKKQGSRLVTVKLGKAEMEVPAELLIRKGFESYTHVEQVTPNVLALLWEGFANNANAFVIRGKDNRWILVDPGHFAHAGSVLAALHTAGLAPDTADAVLFTHGHPDHIESAPIFADLGIPAGLSPKDEEYNKTLGRMLFLMGQNAFPGVAYPIRLEEGKLDLPGFSIEVVHTPGHTPGSVCFWLPAEKVLITGDLVFDQGVGRTDFPGGSTRALFESIARVEAYPAEHVCPGHGPVVKGRSNVEDNFRIVRRFAGYM